MVDKTLLLGVKYISTMLGINLSDYLVPGTLLHAMHAFSHFILTITNEVDGYHYSHFTDQETELREVIKLTSNSQQISGCLT